MENKNYIKNQEEIILLFEKDKKIGIEDINNYKEIDDRLKVIIKAECKKGNFIDSTSKSWPNKETILIAMKYSFISNYNIDGVDYYLVNDPHYWKDEYRIKENKHMVISTFFSIKD